MEIKSIFDREFASYGQVHPGYHLEGLLSAMESIPLPEQGTDYRLSIPELEGADCFRELEDRAFGGMPIQVGMCWGHNTRLNCLEYHRSSEFNLGTVPFVLLLAHQWEIVDGVLDADKVAAFYVPAGTLVEVYATSPALCSLPRGCRRGLPGGGGAAQGHQYGEAGAGQPAGREPQAVGPEQVAPGPPGQRGGPDGRSGGSAGQKHGYRRKGIKRGGRRTC